MASTSARPKGVRPPGGGFFHAATRCSCSDRRPRISAAGSLRSPHRLPALSGWLRRHPETDPASRTGARRLPPVRARVFRDPRRAATAGSLPPCVWPTSVPGRRAALREPLRSPFGLPAGLPKLVLSLCSQTPPCVISHSFSPQFGVQENPRARDVVQSKRFTPQFRRSNTLIANNFRSRGPLAFGRGSALTTYGWRAIMITNRKATTVRTWFRKLTAARLILLMLTCLPVWGKSPQTVSNQDLMKIGRASCRERV